MDSDEERYFLELFRNLLVTKLGARHIPFDYRLRDSKSEHLLSCRVVTIKKRKHLPSTMEAVTEFVDFINGQQSSTCMIDSLGIYGVAVVKSFMNVSFGVSILYAIDWKEVRKTPTIVEGWRRKASRLKRRATYGY